MSIETTSPNGVLRYLLDTSGKSAYRLSLDLGRSRNYLINALGKDTHISTLVSVADITGRRLAVLDADTDDVVAVIDPPERAPEQRERPKPKPKGESKDA